MSTVKDWAQNCPRSSFTVRVLLKLMCLTYLLEFIDRKQGVDLNTSVDISRCVVLVSRSSQMIISCRSHIGVEKRS